MQAELNVSKLSSEIRQKEEAMRKLEEDLRLEQERRAATAAEAAAAAAAAAEVAATKDALMAEAEAARAAGGDEHGIRDGTAGVGGQAAGVRKRRLEGGGMESQQGPANLQPTHHQQQQQRQVNAPAGANGVAPMDTEPPAAAAGRPAAVQGAAAPAAVVTPAAAAVAPRGGGAARGPTWGLIPALMGLKVRQETWGRSCWMHASRLARVPYTHPLRGATLTWHESWHEYPMCFNTLPPSPLPHLLQVSTPGLWQQLWCTCSPAITLLLNPQATLQHGTSAVEAPNAGFPLSHPLSLAAAAAGQQLQLVARGMAGSMQLLQALTCLLRVSAPPQPAALVGAECSLPHAVAALQLMRVLVLLDQGSCQAVAELLGMRQQQQQHRQQGGRAGSTGARAWGATAAPLMLPPGCSAGLTAGLTRLTGWEDLADAGAMAKGPLGNTAALNMGSGATARLLAGATGSTSRLGELEDDRSLLAVIMDAEGLGDDASLAAARALAACAAQTPDGLRALLPVIADGFLGRLLHLAGSYQHRCAGLALLQQLLRCTMVCEALAAALAPGEGGAPAQGDGGGQQQQQSLSVGEQGTGGVAEGPSGSQQVKRKQQDGLSHPQHHQQQQQQGSSDNLKSSGSGGASSSSGSGSFLISLQPGVVAEILLGVLDCLNSSLDGGRRRSPRRRSSASASGSSSGGSNGSGGIGGPSSCACRRWGRFELQRRALCVVASIAQGLRESLLLALLSEDVACGEGLMQRLLAVADMACSPQAAGADPLTWVRLEVGPGAGSCQLQCCGGKGAPQPSSGQAAMAGPSSSQAVAHGGVGGFSQVPQRAPVAAGSGGSSSGGSGDGGVACDADEWGERVRLAREALLQARWILGRGDQIGEQLN